MMEEEADEGRGIDGRSVGRGCRGSIFERVNLCEWIKCESESRQ